MVLHNQVRVRDASFVRGATGTDSSIRIDYPDRRLFGRPGWICRAHTWEGRRFQDNPAGAESDSAEGFPLRGDSPAGASLAKISLHAAGILTKARDIGFPAG
jgi:hypothetical protein